MRDGLLFLHIVGVAGWLGGGAYALYTYSALAPMEPAAAGPALQRLKKVEDRFFGPVSGLVLLSGIGLVLTSDAFGWGDAFVLIGLGAFLISAIIGATVGKRNSERLVEATTSGTGVGEALRSWRRVTVWDFVILAVVVWAMITKLGA
ncbi:MAG TPA: DUF2269 family protein [Acidimicrobiia bacterium]|nr:DUF2269 family protein [Acidimicrobiia bacterium]